MKNVNLFNNIFNAYKKSLKQRYLLCSQGYGERNLYHLPLPNYFSRGKYKSLSLEAILISSNSNILCRIFLPELSRIYK